MASLSSFDPWRVGAQLLLRDVRGPVLLRLRRDIAGFSRKQTVPKLFLHFFFLASVMQINKINIRCLPVQNLRGKKIGIWKCSAIPTIIIGCSFENKEHISETPKRFL